MTNFDSLSSKQKQMFGRGFVVLGAGLVLTSIALFWHPAFSFMGVDRTELLHHVVEIVAIILELTGMIILISSKPWNHGDES